VSSYLVYLWKIELDLLKLVDPNDVKFFPQMTPILGRTLEEAQAKAAKYRKCLDWEAGLAKMSGFVNFDFAKLPPDEPFVFDEKSSDNAIHTLIKTIKRYDGDGTLTPRKLGEQMVRIYHSSFSQRTLITPGILRFWSTAHRYTRDGG